jgi:hypothetical protein
MIPQEDQKIIAYGQETEIIRVEKIRDGYRCYIDPSIVVPTSTYTRDYVHSNEIQKYL